MARAKRVRERPRITPEQHSILRQAAAILDVDLPDLPQALAEPDLHVARGLGGEKRSSTSLDPSHALRRAHREPSPPGIEEGTTIEDWISQDRSDSSEDQLAGFAGPERDAIENWINEPQETVPQASNTVPIAHQEYLHSNFSFGNGNWTTSDQTGTESHSQRYYDTPLNHATIPPQSYMRRQGGPSSNANESLDFFNDFPVDSAFAANIEFFPQLDPVDSIDHVPYATEALQDGSMANWPRQLGVEAHLNVSPPNADITEVGRIQESSYLGNSSQKSYRRVGGRALSPGTNPRMDSFEVRRRRKPFQNAQEREETSKTRRLAACIRCRNQRIRCLPDHDDPRGRCRTCISTSGQSLYRFPCLRYKVTDSRLFQANNKSGFKWSRRWPQGKISEIREWASPEIKTILITQKFTLEPLELKVRAFIPVEGDLLERRWVDGTQRKAFKVPNYAILDMEATTLDMQKHLDTTLPSGINTILIGHDPIIRETYITAYNHRFSSVPEDEKKLMKNVLRLWYATRMTCMSVRMCGEEKLGMIATTDTSYPLFGEIPIPPVMGAQHMMMLVATMLEPLRKSVLKQFQDLFKSTNSKCWFTIYLGTFILLHSCSLVTAHAGEYARKHGAKERFSEPTVVEEMHLGAKILLAHFHYCNKGFYPFTVDSPKQQVELSSVADLNNDQTQFIIRTSKYFREREADMKFVRDCGVFEDPFYFVSQMFEQDWQPRRTI